MPRQARLDAPGTLHHVTIRGIEGKSIFRDNRDRKEFVTRLGNLAKERGTRVLAWSFLRNHVHLLLYSGPSGLAYSCVVYQPDTLRDLTVGMGEEDICPLIRYGCAKTGFLLQNEAAQHRSKQKPGM